MISFEKVQKMEPLIREKFTRNLLGPDKCKVLDKYNLTLNERLYFERIEAKYPTQEFFSLKFALKASVLGMIFQIYKLCFAKTKYFENNWQYFCPCVYDYKTGFKETELYNMEFIMQKSTKITIDLRYLSTIHDIKVFKDLCSYLENQESTVTENNLNAIHKTV